MQGRVFLKEMAPSTTKDLVVFGSLELDVMKQSITVQIEGYDGQNNTDWLVIMSPFSTRSLPYLTEVYIQLVFDLLNEPTSGLKAIFSPGKSTQTDSTQGKIK